MTRLYLLAACLALSTLGLFALASHFEQKGVDKATAIHQKQLAEAARKAAEQREKHQAAMRQAELNASKSIAVQQAKTQTLRVKLNETTKHLDSCRLGDAVRLLNDAASAGN